MSSVKTNSTLAKSTPLFRITTAALLTAIAVVGASTVVIPFDVAKCAPVQHMVNVCAGVLLGPVWGTVMAFAASLIRVLLGTGTIMAFPGSMVGALLAGLLFHLTKKTWAAALGEVVGTGILGAIAGSFLSRLVLGTEAGILLYIPSFLISSAAGAAIALILLPPVRRVIGRLSHDSSNA
ncbi:energy coupling factor transporter S component ThiW [Solibaculum mannosilyticum]|uniref:Energy coupling factor transporter S component ThiW n=1 Tax=Solibaculum mannosilyticum TaxID=2780922 RepID=A0A7I8CZD5_9FIRM|nr:energy coupling factor transporter S component ThiW [Solibaculum mannosilyticum]BCI59776.1 hypothetical protein C12CBH8_04150 [Solibaculum mannosilyticum]